MTDSAQEGFSRVFVSNQQTNRQHNFVPFVLNFVRFSAQGSRSKVSRFLAHLKLPLAEEKFKPGRPWPPTPGRITVLECGLSHCPRQLPSSMIKVQI